MSIPGTNDRPSDQPTSNSGDARLRHVGYQPPADFVAEFSELSDGLVLRLLRVAPGVVVDPFPPGSAAENDRNKSSGI